MQAYKRIGRKKKLLIYELDKTESIEIIWVWSNPKNTIVKTRVKKLTQDLVSKIKLYFNENEYIPNKNDEIEVKYRELFNIYWECL